MNGKLINVSLCFMFGMKLDVRNVEKDIDRPGKLKRLIYIEGDLYSSQLKY